MPKIEYTPPADPPPWNAGRKVGSKRALKLRQVWAVRFLLDHNLRLRDRAMFDLAIDSKLRGCDIVKIKIGELVIGDQIRSRAIVVLQKTGRPVQFELMTDARVSLPAWLEYRGGTVDDYAFPSRPDRFGHISTRQYARLVDEWITGIGLGREGTVKGNFAAFPALVSEQIAGPRLLPCSVYGRERSHDF